MLYDLGLERAVVEKKLRACEPKNYKDYDGCWAETRAGADYPGLMGEWFRLEELCNIRKISETDIIEMIHGCCSINESHVVDVAQELIE